MFKSIKYYVGQHIEYDEVVQNLIDFGYVKKKHVSQEGDFAKRGSILDIFPSNFDSPIRIDLFDDKINQIVSYSLVSAKSIWRHKIVIIFPLKKRKLKTPFTEDVPINNFVDIQRGDFVVHNNHGVGKFLGIKELDVGHIKQDHMIIEYKDGDRLFVPKKDMHLVQKYISFNKKTVYKHKLGGKEWKSLKKSIEKKLQRTAAELLRVQAMRASLKGFVFPKDDKWQKDFEEVFEFIPTDDQLKCAAEVKADMQATTPMDRLVCGDVGYGKTEVALRGIFKAVNSGKQVAVLVPTTILAEQHFLNFSERMKDFPITVAMLSRFRTKAEQVETIKQIKEGVIDILIGTHRLLSKDVQFKDLGLIVIDEEQRFGVTAKEKLKHMRVLVDVLTLTATPIPRTLYMALAGSRDMSVITTPPKNRLDVSTHVIEFDEDLIKRAIEREIKRGGQTFFLHNRVQDIEKIAKILQRLVPEARMEIAHGQMPPRQLEEIMLKFVRAEIDCLVCTTIIGSGIDIPKANTLIINRADHFGLSDLHQLRGRVGRKDIKAYAYFVIPPKNTLSTVARQRLEVMEKYSTLGAGFQIAFEDLQIRGAGNLLGKEQHGFVASVGFDLYCRMLKESVENLKQEMELHKYEVLT